MSPATVLGLITGQFPSFKSNFTFFDFIIDMNNLNSNYGYPNSNETNSPALAGSRAPGGHVAASSATNLSRPRLMKMRKHTSYNPRFSDSRREEESDFSLRFNPFRSSSESIFGDSSSVNVPKKSFSFGAGSGNSNLGSESLIVDDLRKMQIDSDKSYTNVMVDQLPKGINKLNIGDSSNNVNTNKSQFTSTCRGNVEAELRHEMHKMNRGNNSNTFVFGRNSKSDESLISDKLGELKVGGDRDDNMKNFVFGSKTLNYGKQNKEENVKDDLISDKMQELKVGGGGVEFMFGQNVEPKVCESRSCSNVQPFGNAKFTSSPLKNVDFTFSSKLDNFGSPNVELKNKKKGKVRKPVIGQARTKQDFVFGQSSGQNSESFEAYSPMDVSPYQETLAAIYSRGTSVTSDDDVTSQINDQNSVVSSESHIINSNITTDEELIGAIQRLNVNDSDVKCEVSEAETFISAVENIEHSSDTFATAWDSDLSSTATSGKQEKTGTRLFKFGSKLENINKDNFTFAASTSSQGQHKKKHRLKTGQDSYSPTSDARNTDASSSPSSILSSGNTQKVDMSTLSSKNKDKFKPINGQDSKHGNLSTASVSIAAEEACEKWRLRGNQAYGNGDLAKAEDYYTQGLNSVSQTEKSKGCLRALMLCYSNRAATRISLGKMKEALKDCLMAAAIDPNFFKVQVRAAHCYLAIGEVEKASLQYMKCLQSGSEVCIDRKLLIEASKGLENSQKVTECFKQYTELPRKTPDELESTLRVIDEALQISSYSEQLLQMKADTLLMLRKFEQIIQMCEQTLSSAEISETPTSTSSWRSNLIVKSYFYLGRLEEANEFIKKQESSGLLTERLGSMSLESVIPLADVIHELLSRKAAGNESYKLGKYAEAVEHYTSALSCSVESRPFAAICFCNRAAAYRSLGQISDAIADCSLAIALDPNYLKAISRRASLYEMIRDYGQATKDLRKLVSLFTSQIEEKGIISGVSDKSSGVNELRQTQLQLYNIEEESRKEIPLNMYLILGVESTAAASEIKKAYRKAALKHHPDKAALSVSRSNNGDDRLWKEIAENVYKDADRLFKMIGEAYAVLSNPSKRSQYDMDEEIRNEDNKYTRSCSGRMAAEFQSPMYERSGSRRWQDNSWRSYVYSQSNGQEMYTSSYRYSKHS